MDWRVFSVGSNVCKMEKKVSAVANFERFSRLRLSINKSAQKLGDGFFNFDFVRMRQPIEISGKGIDFDVSSYLRNALAKQNQI